MTDLPTGRAQLERVIIQRAQSDPAFRERLLADPQAAVAEALRITLPDDLEVQVVQERPDLLCVVLPVDLAGFTDSTVRAMTGQRP